MRTAITRRALFLCFLELGLCSFGGVLPWARRMLVEKRAWMSEEEFSAALSLGQILPGPNIVNLAIMFGTRIHGAPGALLAFAGLMLAPLAIILGLVGAYTQYGHLAVVQGALHGMAAACAGLVLSLGINMALRQKQDVSERALTALSFVTAGVLALPIVVVLLCLAPLGIFNARRKQ